MKRPKGPSLRRTRLVSLHTAIGDFTAWWDKWWGLGEFALRRPDGTQGDGRTARQLKKESAMKRPEKASATGLPSLAERQESLALSMFPHVEELLLDPNWDDLAPKGKRCLMFFIDDTAVRCLVKLEADLLKASCVARGFDECLAALELLLKTGQVVWEQDSPPPARGKKKGS
jgi:hypothetical protein